MHNCRATRELFTEHLLDRANRGLDESLSTELNECFECYEEFRAVKETLLVTGRLIEKAVPAESYWLTYHATLKQKVIQADRRAIETVLPARKTPWWTAFFKSTIRIPLPVGGAFVVLFVLSLILLVRAQGRVESPTQVSVVRIPVEVPVVQEKIVTRVVYRESRRRVSPKDSNGVVSSPEADAALARSQAPNRELRPATLIGFKPLDEVKLTVIKGGPPDEK
jgi:hypothetical protein